MSKKKAGLIECVKSKLNEVDIEVVGHTDKDFTVLISALDNFLSKNRNQYNSNELAALFEAAKPFLVVGDKQSPDEPVIVDNNSYKNEWWKFQCPHGTTYTWSSGMYCWLNGNRNYDPSKPYDINNDRLCVGGFDCDPRKPPMRIE